MMLEAISSSALDQYHDLIQRYYQRYGPSVWLILYQADVRARMDHMERMRRQGAKLHATGSVYTSTHVFVPARPWDWHCARPSTTAASGGKKWRNQLCWSWPMPAVCPRWWTATRQWRAAVRPQQRQARQPVRTRRPQPRRTSRRHVEVTSTTSQETALWQRTAGASSSAGAFSPACARMSEWAGAPRTRTRVTSAPSVCSRGTRRQAQPGPSA